MQTAISALRTWMASRSASEWAATVRRPSVRQARWMRSAISPRLAMRTVLNIGLIDPEKRLAGIDLVTGGDEHGPDGSIALGFHLVEDLHGLDDADGGTRPHGLPDLYEGGLAGRRRQIDGAGQRGGNRRLSGWPFGGISSVVFDQRPGNRDRFGRDTGGGSGPSRRRTRRNVQPSLPTSISARSD